MIERLKDKTELAALLDGELRDPGRIEELNALLADDAALKAEYDEQRQMKGLLAGLNAYEAPDYLSTRVLGEIAARDGKRSTSRLKVWLSATAGFAACLLLVVVFNQFGQPQPAMLAEDLSQNGVMVRGGMPASDGGGVANLPMLPVVDGNPEVADFLQFAAEAHHYNRLEHQLTQMTPDMPTAIWVLEGGQAYAYVLDEALSRQSPAEPAEDDEDAKADTASSGEGQ